VAEVAPALPGIVRALVIGTGRSGLAATRALVDHGVRVTVVDEARAPAGAAAIRDTGATLHTGGDPQEHLHDVDLLVPSPGVPEGAAVITTALGRGLPVWSEPELGLRLAPRRLVAVTGTNGKTSVTELTSRVLLAGGIDAVACGNIGTPVTEAAAGAHPDAVLVAELSSFQLRFCHILRPEVGLLLNLAPDHLDWHGDLAAYGAAKARMWQAQQPGDWAVHNDEDDVTRTLSDQYAPAGRAAFAGGTLPAHGVGVQDGWIVSTLDQHREAIVAVAELPLTAPHHRANVAAAATAGLLLGVAPDDIAAAAIAFRPGRHRLEPVADVGGVAYVDDSKATNAHAAAAALASFDAIVWVAGGIAKGVDLSLLADHLGAVRAAVVMGQSADELAAVCRRAGVPVRTAATMDAAVGAAAELARPGDTVLLAPACSSFDMFADYADRGDRFAAAVRALPTAPAATPSHTSEQEGHDGRR
jgi:UDP-N-acetylmuramoylalanine--D-glutamate ligase